MSSTTLLVLATLALTVSGDDFNAPHQHSGVFKSYTTGPPKKAGFKLSAAEIKRIAQTHEAECAVVVLPVSTTSPKGTMRCTSVQDIAAPPEIVWTLLLDFNRYPTFVGGITACSPYARRRTLTGGKVIDAKYTAAVGPFKLRYYIEHNFEPLQHSMTWTLDYTKSSDIFDSVGYWYVEQTAGGSRVYYTQDTLLPSWIPAGLRKTFTKVAMRAATSKLEPACLAEMKSQERRTAPFRLPLPKLELPKLPQVRVPQLPTAMPKLRFGKAD